MKAFLSSAILVFAFISNLAAIHPKDMLLTDDGKPNQGLISLLELDGLYNPEDTLQQIVQKTQSKWVRRNQGLNKIEIPDLVDSPEEAAQRETVERIALQMGLFSGNYPAFVHYEYAICQGAFLDGLRWRLSQLVKVWQAGIRFDKLVFLTGERDLRKEPGEKDDLAFLLDEKQSPLPFKKDWIYPPGASYETEYDLVKLVWDQIELPLGMAEALEGHVYFVNAPKGNFPRPGTREAYQEWVKTCQPAPGLVISLSHPLLWTYMHLVGENCLDERFVLDSVAPDAYPLWTQRYKASLVSIVKDTVAKCLYELSLKE